MKRDQTVHDWMMERVQNYTLYIKNGRKLVAIKSEEKIKEIAVLYSKDDNYIPRCKIEQLITVFQNCQKTGVWHADLSQVVEKTIQNLKNSL